MAGVLLCLATLLPHALQARAQQPLVLSGRVVRVSGSDSAGLRGAMVVLHRIGMSEQGPADSLASDALGRFRFSVPSPDTQSLYVVSVRYAGIGYFSEPHRGRGEDGSGPITLAVFDTAAAGPELGTALRHVIIGPPSRGAARRVLDIFQIRNTDTRTRVGRDTLEAVWRARLPRQARDPQASEGDIAPSAIRFAGDTVLVSAAFPPGDKQVVLTYELAEAARSLVIPIDQPVAELEVLVEDEGASAVAGLLEREGMTVEDRRFRRFVAGALSPGSAVELGLGRARVPLPVTEIAVGMAALALAGGLLLALRARNPAGAAGEPASRAAAASGGADDDREKLLARLVALDERYEARQQAVGAQEWEEYRRRRAALKARLAELVASERR